MAKSESRVLHEIAPPSEGPYVSRALLHLFHASEIEPRQAARFGFLQSLLLIGSDLHRHVERQFFVEFPLHLPRANQRPQLRASREPPASGCHVTPSSDREPG